MSRGRPEDQDAKTDKEDQIVRLHCTGKDLAKLIQAAHQGEFDRVPIETPNGTVFMRVEEIAIARADAPTTVLKTWKRREQNQSMPGSPGSEDSISR